ncbi:MAG: DUF294 nucleotidyltransferase-like domain-containing protein [Pseudomonadota bacterium]
MAKDIDEFSAFLAQTHPCDGFDDALRAEVAGAMERVDVAEGEPVYRLGDALRGLYFVVSGRVEVRHESGRVLSVLGPGQCFGERGLLRDGDAVTATTALEATSLLVMPRMMFDRLRLTEPAFARVFSRPKTAETPTTELTATPLGDLMAKEPITCTPGDTLQEAARLMRDRGVSSLPVLSDGKLCGILTSTDLTNRAMAEGLPAYAKVETIMTRDPITLRPDALGADVLTLMLERDFHHVPVVADGALVGIVSQSDLTRFQAMTSGHLIRGIAGAEDAETIAEHVAHLPQLLAQLVGAGHRHDTVTRLVTDVADAATRRLLTLAEAELGAPPVPYLWLACGSQGRQEQTGVSDQDNCLILHDDVTEDDLAYFDALAKRVSDGLNACGYYYCPGDMMATNPQWRQPVKAWRSLFQNWIRKPDPKAQMLASVMFDLRGIGGDEDLYASLQAEVLEKAAANSIFVAHMVGNALKHTPALGFFGGFAKVRSGEHRNTIDLKMNGVVPIVDIGRVCALRGRLGAVNTHARLVEAEKHKLLSASGARDLLDAYDMIATTRLVHQAQRVRAGQAPDNFLVPSELSDLERNHLHDAFVVVKTIQSALGITGAALR